MILLVNCNREKHMIILNRNHEFFECISQIITYQSKQVLKLKKKFNYLEGTVTLVWQ